MRNPRFAILCCTMYAPSGELLYLQVDVYSEKKGLIIVGYYHANQRLEDNRSVNDSRKHLPFSK